MRTELVLGVLVCIASSPEAWASSCVPGFDYALFAKDGVHIQGNAGTDSYDSSLGTYAATRACSDAHIGTNAIGAGDMHVHSGSAHVCGDGVVGAGGNPASAITGNGTITGARRALDANLALPNVTVPNLPDASPLDRSPKHSHTSLAPGFEYRDVSCQNGSLTLNAGVYVVRSLSLTANCELRVATAPVAVYFTAELQLQAGVVVNASNVAANLVFYGGPAATSVQVQGGVDASFAVYAPTADCELHGNADVYGALVCANVHVQGNAHVHYDRALATFEGAGFQCPPIEISRASPIVAIVDNRECIVQGTFDRPRGTRPTIRNVADVARFAFPYVTGHLRARAASSISTAGSSFASGTTVFDARTVLPPVQHGGCARFDGTCRNVFTVTQAPGVSGTSLRPPRVALTDSNASTIGALIAPASAVPGIGASQWQTIVRAVVGGALGGIDRSTAAVIGPSPLAGVATRPTIAYVGGTDGMLHAVCASTGGTTESTSSVCPRLGAELWAFLPRTQLPLVRENLARVDGSPRVVDVFGDFAGTGRRGFRTILTLQTGSDAAVYALDVTDPADPIVLWEYSPPGIGLAMAAGPVLIGGKPTNLAIAQTNDAAGAGMIATALSIETGTPRWSFAYRYPSPPRGVAADAPLPATGVPGGAVGVALGARGFVTDVVMGDLYGNLWRLDAATGASRTGATTPLFQFSTNKRPIGALPAIYSDGDRQFAVFGSGGYVDPIAATWSANRQWLVSIDLATKGPYPIDERSPKLAFADELDAGERALAQVLVVGDELFAVTDRTDVNTTDYGTTSTGGIITHDLATHDTTTIAVRGGASSLAASGTTLFTSSGDQQQRLGTEAASTQGATVDTAVAATLRRLVWLRER